MLAGMSPWQLFLVLVFTVAPALAGWSIGHGRKGRPVLGAVLGFFLSWAGVLAIALIPARRRERMLVCRVSGERVPYRGGRCLAHQPDDPAEAIAALSSPATRACEVDVRLAR